LTALIVGDASDTHVEAVVAAIGALGGEAPIILDGPSLQRIGFSLDLDRLIHAGEALPIRRGGRGWLRRYAPTAWGTGTVAGSLEAVTKRAFLALIGSISRIGDRSWLTPVDRLLAAEDRLVQLEVASSLALRVPDSLVTSNPAEAANRFGSSFVVKPISGGYFWTEDGPRAVFASQVTSEQAMEADFGAAPFVAQELLTAVEHLRVVTVGERAWVASLSAEGRPLDWRRQDEAHFEWRPTRSLEVSESALRLARSLRVGYSSQDWIRDEDGLTFLDLNPGGQWLFLPTSVSEPVTVEIARYLCKGVS
jgi:hypothetical protein